MQLNRNTQMRNEPAERMPNTTKDDRQLNMHSTQYYYLIKNIY